MGLWPSTKTTDDWIQRNWRPNLEHGVTCYPIGRGFFVFEFISEEDRDLIFRNGPYFMGTQGLYLNKWTPNFDPLVDLPKEVPVWVKLPNLPMHCWDFESLQRIGNGVGWFIDRADNKGQYSCARICVEVDLEVGLPEAIKIKVGDWQHYQKLDNEQFPFKCRGCHQYGHFQRICPKNPIMEKEGEERWQQLRKGRSNSKSKGPRNEKTTPAQSKDQGNKFDKGKENTFKILAQENVEEKAEENTREEAPTEETSGNPTPKVRETQAMTEEEEK
jgi:hypothetical protein